MLLETSARFYRRLAESVSARRSALAAQLPGFEEDVCDGGYSRRVSGTLTSFIPRGSHVARIRIAKLGFVDC